MFVDIQPSVWFGISLACQYPSDLLTVNTVTSESEYQTFFLLFQINSESNYDAGWLLPLMRVHKITGNEVVMW